MPQGLLIRDQHPRESRLKQAALVLSLIPAPGVVLGYLGVAFYKLAQGDSHYFSCPHFLVVFGWVAFFLLVTACARKAPAIGGPLSILSSIALIIWLPRAWWFVLLYVVLLVSGILHLIAWGKGRRGRRLLM
jgi:hypothetical protein